MPFVPIQLPPGVVRGSTPYDSPDRWYSSSLVRWHGGIAQPVGGWQRLSSTGFTNPIRKIQCWRSSAPQRFIVLGTTDKVYTDDSGTWVDITPPGMQSLSAAGAYGYGVGPYSIGTAFPITVTGASTFTFSDPGANASTTGGTATVGGVSKTISTISRTSNVVTVTTSTSHGFATGDSVNITGLQNTTFGNSYGDIRSAPTTIYTSFAFYSFANWGEDLVFTNSSDGKLYYYDVTNPTTDAIQVGLHNITTVERQSNVATITTSTPHGMGIGDSITVAGLTDTALNGNYVVTAVPSSTQVSYNNSGSTFGPSADTGTVLDNTVPASNRAVVVTDERHVMALGVGGNPRRLGWSSRETVEDWNFASTTNTAGFIDIETSTPLLTAINVREGVLLFSETEVFIVRYIGNPFIYSAEYLGSSSILHPNMIATFDGKAMWFDQSGFMIYEGGSIRPIQCPVLDFFKSDIDPIYGSAVSHGSENGIFEEAWFFYPSNGQTECDSYIIFNYNEGWWTNGKLSRTAAFPAGANKFPLMAGTDNNLYAHEDGWTDAGNSRVGDVWLETGALNIGQGDRGWEVRQMLPATGFGYDTLKVTVYGRQAPDGSERVFGPYTPRSNGYMDMRVSARDIRVRFEATEDGDWGIGKMRLEVAPGAGR